MGNKESYQKFKHAKEIGFPVSRNLLKRIKEIENLDKPISAYIEAIDSLTHGSPDDNIGSILIVDSHGLPALKFIPNVQLTKTIKIKMEESLPPRDQKIVYKSYKKPETTVIPPTPVVVPTTPVVEPIKPV